MFTNSLTEIKFALALGKIITYNACANSDMSFLRLYWTLGWMIGSPILSWL